jgi:ankyrin repeat protein
MTVDNKTRLGAQVLKSVIKRDSAAALEIIKLGPDLTLADRCGMSALCHAAAKGLDSVVEALIAAGADINYQNFSKGVGLTPLMRACFDGNDEAADLLLAAGAKVNLQDADGRTALHMASHFDGLCTTPRMVPKLLQVEGIDVDAATKEGCTVLMANFGQPENIYQLLAAGANMEAQDNEGNTAYDRVRGTLLNGRAARVYEGIYETFNTMAREAHEEMINEAVSVMTEGSRTPVQAMRRIRLKGGFCVTA